MNQAPIRRPATLWWRVLSCLRETSIFWPASLALYRRGTSPTTKGRSFSMLRLSMPQRDVSLNLSTLHRRLSWPSRVIEKTWSCLLIGLRSKGTVGEPYTIWLTSRILCLPRALACYSWPTLYLNAIFSRYESGYAKFFDQIASKFDQDAGCIHGLVHLTRDRDNCYCPACMQRRISPISDP